MITINTELCNGCGECVEACPTGAIYLVGGEPVVEQKLCRDCEACIAACPTGAITFSSLKEATAAPARVPAPQPEEQVIQVRTQATPAPLRASVLPLVGGALAWGWREIVPRLAEYLLYDLDRGRATRQTPVPRRSNLNNGSPGRGRGRGRGRRWRRRGGK